MFAVDPQLLDFVAIGIRAYRKAFSILEICLSYIDLRKTAYHATLILNESPLTRIIAVGEVRSYLFEVFFCDHVSFSGSFDQAKRFSNSTTAC